MSIATEISRLQTAKADIKTAIENKGVTVPSSTTLDGYATLIDSISSGASNLIQGEFTTGSSAGYDSITLPYTGNGYPIACIVVIKDGAYNSSVSPWYSEIQRYAVGQWTMTKSNMTTSPTYTTSGSQNQGVTTAIYKNSTSSSTSYTRTSSMSSNVYSSSNASNSAALCVRFKSNTTLSYYVNTSSYGLLPEQEYSYIVIYSE